MYITPEIRGIRIGTASMVLLAISFVLFVMLLYSTVQILNKYKASISTMDDFLHLEQASRNLQLASNNLSEQARLYVQTGKMEYMDNYFRELFGDLSGEKQLDILRSHKLHSDDADHDCALKNTLALSDALAMREIYAMRLYAEAAHQDIMPMDPAIRDTRITLADRILPGPEKLKRAQDLLYSREYLADKRAILVEMLNFINYHLIRSRDLQMDQTKNLGSLLDRQRIILIALCIISIMTFAMILFLIVRPLHGYLKCIRENRMIDLSGAYELKQLAVTYNEMYAAKEHHDRILKQRADHDPLTGLLNRSAFESHRELLADDENPIGLLLIDLDKFKDINDNYGHETGDKVLRRVGLLLKENFRSEDRCIRLGGDEFAVIMRGKAHGIEEIVCKKIEKINEALGDEQNDLPPMSVSVGVSFSESGFSKDLYNEADVALYYVKKHGRRGCHIYNKNN